MVRRGQTSFPLFTAVTTLGELEKVVAQDRGLGG
jgi:hypothetical protein